MHIDFQCTKKPSQYQLRALEGLLQITRQLRRPATERRLYRSGGPRLYQGKGKNCIKQVIIAKLLTGVDVTMSDKRRQNSFSAEALQANFCCL